MYILECIENGEIVDTLTTERIEEIGKFFNKNNHVIGVQNSMKTIEQLEENESFKFYKNRNRQKYIEVTRQ